MKNPTRELKPSVLYRVEMHDNYVSGVFFAKFMGWHIEDGQWFSLWDNGMSLGPEWGKWTAVAQVPSTKGGVS